jgi:hypothetical protein
MVVAAALLAAPPPVAAVGATIGKLAIPAVVAPLPLDPHAPPATWSAVPAVSLGWDVQHEAAATEPTTARAATDGANLYVRFDVRQRETLLAQQHNNNVGDGTDDEVWVDLWPGGNSGFYYQFAATSNGTHFQYSSENTAYAPTWESFGATNAGGFVVTMRIPLAVMRGHRGAAWKLQFVRVVRSTGERQIWSYGAGQTNADDVTFAGTVAGLAAPNAARPQPRIGTYGLGQVGAPASGLSTSRLGADFSLPVTSTASFYGTLHPDFSNVEVDQSTIAPTAFERYYSEVRPFFTQGANFYDTFNCVACGGISQLYTPSIPTPRDGYAFEGKEGLFTGAGFDAVGVGRIDSGQAILYASPDQHLGVTLQRITDDCALPGTADCPYGASLVHDDTDTAGISYGDGKHYNGYFNYGSESGTNVAAGDQAQRYDGGIFAYTSTFGIGGAIRKVGYYYDPADGFIQHPDIAGYALYTAKIWLFNPNSFLNSAGVSLYGDRYHNASGALDQTDNQLLVDVLTRGRIDVQGSVGSSYLLENDCLDANGDQISVTPMNQGQYAFCQTFTPITQQGVGITYHSGTANSPGNFPNHGSTSTATSVTYNQGRFGPGRLDAWQRVTTMRAGNRGTISLEADNTFQYLDAGGVNRQWLERGSYSEAIDPNTSLSLGVRRIIGVPPLVYVAAPQSCTTVIVAPPPGTIARCTGAWNLSFAFHRRSPHDELYFAYGDASQLSTYPAWILKFIHYVGAEKGT